MGGGGGYGRGPSKDELARLEEIARKSLRIGEGRRNVFISFANEDLPAVNLLRGQAKREDSEIEFNDWSLREPFDSVRAPYIKQGIRERIRQSSLTIVYLSEATAQSKWVEWEVRESHSQGKKIVAVYQGTPPKTPRVISELKIKMIPWTHDAIARELK